MKDNQKTSVREEIAYSPLKIVLEITALIGTVDSNFLPLRKGLYFLFREFTWSWDHLFRLLRRFAKEYWVK